MAVLVTDLIADIRTDSGLRNNQVFTDADIRRMVLDAGAELYDDVEGSFQAYIISTFDFTLAPGANSVALPADFKRDNSLTYNPTSTTPQRVDPLGSWLERGALSTNAAGTYRLYYTPFFTTSGAGGAEAIPVSMTPWALYLKIQASIAIRTSRQQDTSALDQQLQALKMRVAKSVKNRTQAPRQAPITRRGRGFTSVCGPVNTDRRYWLNGTNLELYGGGAGNGW